MKNINKLTPRQWKLYNYLLTDTSKWFSPREIYENVKGYIWNEKAYDKCTQIRDDKKIINHSTEVDKIIVMKNRAFKIATPEEYYSERSAHLRRFMSQLQEIKDMDAKANMNNQYKLISNKGDVIDEDSKAKPYIETFK